MKYIRSQVRLGSNPIERETDGMEVPDAPGESLASAKMEH